MAFSIVRNIKRLFSLLWADIRRLPQVKRFMTASLPGFHHVPVWDVIQVVWKDIGKPNFSLRASAMAYSFFLAFVPGLLFLFTIIPFFPEPQLKGEMRSVLMDSLPPGSFATFEGILHETFHQRSTTLLSLSFVSVILFAMRGIRTMLQAFKWVDKELFRSRPAWREFAVSFVLFVCLTFILIAGVTFFLVSELVITIFFSYIPILNSFEYQLLHLVNIFVDFLILLVGVSLIYYLGPALKERWAFISPGSIVTAFLLVLAEFGLEYYFANFVNYDRIFGSLGTIILLQVWFFYLSMVLLLGFELNSAIHRLEHKRERMAQYEVE
jgi:membrane protein